MISFSITKLLGSLGGPDRLRQLLEQYGQPVPKSPAVAQWKSRNTLPRRWTAPVLFILSREGIDPLSLMEDVPVLAAPGRPARDAAPDDDPFADTDTESEEVTV